MIVVFKTPENNNFFFGYYDISPLDMNGIKLLAQQAGFIDRMPTKDDILIIGFFDIQNGRWTPLAKTKTWNWQQGCRLQWLGPDFTRYIIYNDRVRNKFVSYILDTRTKEKIKLPLPIYSITSNGHYAVGLNFARLHNVRPGYGYDGVEDDFLNDNHPGRDGIYLMNLKDGKYHLVISTDYLFKNRHIDSMDFGKHWVNHLMFNKSGTRFAFLHRWELPDGGIYTRLYTADINGSEIHLLLDSGAASHFYWKGDEHIICWGRPSSIYSSMRNKKLFSKHFSKKLLPLYHKFFPKGFKQKISGDSYLILKDRVGIVGKIGDGFFIEDGHCSVSPCGNWMLTDTYPDKQHNRRLILYKFSTRSLVELGRYRSLPTGVDSNWDTSGMRCDLHPRWSFNGSNICFDSVHNGSRQIYVLNVNRIIK